MPIALSRRLRYAYPDKWRADDDLPSGYYVATSLDGFDFRYCQPVTFDTTRRILSFAGGPIPRSTHPAQIEFSLKNASLYAFWTETTRPRNL